MADTTDLIGWPYPEASDLIAQGAAKIEELAEAIEGTFFLPKNKFAADSPYNSWPPGMSLMTVTGSDFPYSAGMVITYTNYAQSAAWQYFYPQTAAPQNQRVYVRAGYTPSGGSPTWAKWDTVSGPGSPDAMASGNVTITPQAGEVSSATVTFPSGRFQYAPAVFTQYRGGSPGVSTAPSNVTNTSFTLNVLRATASSTYVYWLAVGNQGE